MQDFDLSAMTADELDQLIADATRERETRNAPGEHARTEDGVKGQDVNDPNHGAITTPSPHQVRDVGFDGLQPGARVEGTRVIDADEVSSAERIEQAARRVV
ncbi:hypothetical protein C0V73_19380 [Rhizobium sp. TH135]|uniref:hypothetical protein n=1 Tax=Rhizobium sp. TH135 TaxID=2067451 RepID=UPI000C7990EF|nr:hypothetical protein [Rhizobium sp. TH135]PLK69658.1 hypothetical protein C0V73_19380 [Rhizobium sp. TH135]